MLYMQSLQADLKNQRSISAGLKSTLKLSPEGFAMESSATKVAEGARQSLPSWRRSKRKQWNEARRTSVSHSSRHRRIRRRQKKQLLKSVAATS